MKRNKESKARIRWYSYAKFTKTEQRAIDEIVMNSSVSYCKIYKLVLQYRYYLHFTIPSLQELGLKLEDALYIARVTNNKLKSQSYWLRSPDSCVSMPKLSYGVAFGFCF